MTLSVMVPNDMLTSAIYRAQMEQTKCSKCEPVVVSEDEDIE